MLAEKTGDNKQPKQPQRAFPPQKKAFTYYWIVNTYFRIKNNIYNVVIKSDITYAIQLII